MSRLEDLSRERRKMQPVPARYNNLVRFMVFRRTADLVAERDMIRVNNLVDEPQDRDAEQEEEGSQHESGAENAHMQDDGANEGVQPS